MFGYVRIYKPELKVREYEEYKAVYCTLCRTLGREYGQASRLLLSYDAAFYVLLCGAGGAQPAYQKGRCRFNPAKVCCYETGGDALYREAAALTVILAYHKARDDRADKKGARKAAAALLCAALRGSYKKAAKRYPAFAEIAGTAMEAQAALEAAHCASADRAADPSARALAALCTALLPAGDDRRVTERIAYCVGRWVYLMDAYDDLEKDLKSGAYNPFLLQYGVQTPADVRGSTVQAGILRSLYMTENEAAETLALLSGPVRRAILENILCDGLHARTESIRAHYQNENDRPASPAPLPVKDGK